MEFNSDKVRWNLNQDLRNKKKTQTRIRSSLNSFDIKITKLMEIANLLHYRLSALGVFFGSQQTNNTPPITAPRKCCKIRYIKIKE